MNTAANKSTKLSRNAVPQAYDRKKAQGWLQTAKGLELEFQQSPGLVLCEIMTSEEFFGGKQQAVAANVWVFPIDKEFEVTIIRADAPGALELHKQKIRFRAETLDEAVAIAWVVSLRYTWTPPVLKEVETFQKAGCNVLSIISEMSLAMQLQNTDLELQLEVLGKRVKQDEEGWAEQFEVPDEYSNGEDNDIMPASVLEDEVQEF